MITLICTLTDVEITINLDLSKILDQFEPDTRACVEAYYKKKFQRLLDVFTQSVNSSIDSFPFVMIFVKNLEQKLQEAGEKNMTYVYRVNDGESAIAVLMSYYAELFQKDIEEMTSEESFRNSAFPGFIDTLDI